MEYSCPWQAVTPPRLPPPCSTQCTQTCTHTSWHQIKLVISKLDQQLEQESWMPLASSTVNSQYTNLKLPLPLHFVPCSTALSVVVSGGGDAEAIAQGGNGGVAIHLLPTRVTSCQQCHWRVRRQRPPFRSQHHESLPAYFWPAPNTASGYGLVPLCKCEHKSHPVWATLNKLS